MGNWSYNSTYRGYNSTYNWVPVGPHFAGDVFLILLLYCSPRDLGKNGTFFFGFCIVFCQIGWSHHL